MSNPFADEPPARRYQIAGPLTSKQRVAADALKEKLGIPTDALLIKRALEALYHEVIASAEDDVTDTPEPADRPEPAGEEEG